MRAAPAECSGGTVSPTWAGGREGFFLEGDRADSDGVAVIPFWACRVDVGGGYHVYRDKEGSCGPASCVWVGPVLLLGLPWRAELDTLARGVGTQSHGAEALTL